MFCQTNIEYKNQYNYEYSGTKNLLKLTSKNKIEIIGGKIKILQRNTKGKFNGVLKKNEMKKCAKFRTQLSKATELQLPVYLRWFLL